jgi:phosphonate transport system substrate-binding protein
VLRFVTYLAPSLPEAMFAAVVEHTGRALGRPVVLAVEAELSGPDPNGPDPFSAGAVDVGFMCAPSYVRLSAAEPPPVVPLAAPVFDGAGVDDRPVYYSDVIVRGDDPATSVADLVAARWGFNDPISLSGYHSLPSTVDRARARHTGSHLRSIELIVGGELDAAAIDSNVLAIRLRSEPGLRDEIRVVERLGPFPVQPVVASSRLAGDELAALTNALLGMHEDARAVADLEPFGLRRFVAVTPADYRDLAGAGLS